MFWPEKHPFADYELAERSPPPLHLGVEPAPPRPHDDDQRGHGAVDSDREQVAGCIYVIGRSHAAGPAADRRGRWSVGGQKFRARELCGQVSSRVLDGGVVAKVGRPRNPQLMSSSIGFRVAPQRHT